jgi:prepilin-type N-terminal cleavage/methylation domain-containing protein/prepilin-type processing-associated H-X9-DG protein
MITLNKTERKGFTLIELLVVIAIIAILAAILFPVFAKAREKSRQTVCTSNQRQLAVALTMYAQDHEQRLPNSNTWKTSLGGSNGISGKSWECPSASKSGDNAVSVYGYNAWLSDRVTGDIDNPAKVLMTADSAGGVNILNSVTDIDTNRHSSKAVASYVDGHSEAGSSFDLVPCPISKNSMQFWVMADMGVTADATTGAVTVWKDQSGKARDLTPNTISPILQSSAMNGKPAIRFSGVTNCGMQVDFRTVAPTALAKWSIFIVCNSGPFTSTGGHIVGAGGFNAGAYGSDYENPPGGGFYVSPQRVTKDYIQAGPGTGVSVFSCMTTTSNYSAYGFSVGKRAMQGGDYYLGDVSEVILFSPPISNAEGNTVYEYLKKKWGILQ